MKNDREWISPEICRNKIKAAEVKLRQLKEKHIEPVERELSHWRRKLGQREPFKPGDILTDGTMFIRIGYVSKPEWTTADIHRPKDYNYSGCSYYRPHEDSPWPIMDSSQNIPQLWFNEGHHLFDFVVVSPKLFDKALLSKFVTK